MCWVFFSQNYFLAAVIPIVNVTSVVVALILLLLLLLCCCDAAGDAFSPQIHVISLFVHEYWAQCVCVCVCMFDFNLAFKNLMLKQRGLLRFTSLHFILFFSISMSFSFSSLITCEFSSFFFVESTACCTYQIAVASVYLFSFCTSTTIITFSSLRSSFANQAKPVGSSGWRNFYAVKT